MDFLGGGVALISSCYLGELGGQTCNGKTGFLVHEPKTLDWLICVLCFPVTELGFPVTDLGIVACG